jgi:threonyl-tRNA synthetase
MHNKLKLTLPDDRIELCDLGIKATDLIKQYFADTKNIIALKVDDAVYDLHSEIDRDGAISAVIRGSLESLEILRHDTAHLLAQAVKELYPETQITIGPVIENGFYYDFAHEKPFSSEDLDQIETKMRAIAANNNNFVKETWDRDEAIKFFESMGEFYKAEIIRDISANQKITLYRQGDFVDLCRGPHGRSVGYIKHFKLLKVAGAYWRGDSNQAMLQRIYGTCWETKEQLEQYLYMLEEAQKRDHRKLGKELELFHMQEEAQGMVFWHQKGWQIFLILEQYIRNKLTKHGYIEVKTPMLLDKSFWETSGHWEKFRENMFALDSDNKTLAMKPMNCPCHVQIFNQGIKSYRDLPLRMAEFGVCHRYEPSGALHGLMRVRSFVQDDAHIFCTEDQITSETIAFCKLLKEVYADFGFQEIKIKFSDRPKTRAGSDEVWTKAENALISAAVSSGIEYTTNPGEGAFYGPKLEFVLRDAIGRDWQCGTLQVDFVLPERLNAHYIDSDGKKHVPVMLHRAILGSLERFIGILIEEYSGTFPVWLAPVQVALLTISDKFNDHALTLVDQLKKHNIRVEFDQSSEKIGYKIRSAVAKRIPLTVIIGKNEVESNMVSLRKLGSQENEIISLEELINYIYSYNHKYN